MQKLKGITSTEEKTEGNTQRIAAERICIEVDRPTDRHFLPSLMGEKRNCTLAAFFCNRNQLLEALQTFFLYA
jgi:hypothetical protein